MLKYHAVIGGSRTQVSAHDLLGPIGGAKLLQKLQSTVYRLVSDDASAAIAKHLSMRQKNLR
jgi:hypothetical protein